MYWYVYDLLVYEARDLPFSDDSEVREKSKIGTYSSAVIHHFLANHLNQFSRLVSLYFFLSVLSEASGRYCMKSLLHSFLLILAQDSSRSLVSNTHIIAT